jgi:sugar lactone lactonase YvrE
MPTTAPIRAAAVGATLGEGPVWDAVRQCLWFVDIKQPRLFRFDPVAGSLQHWVAPAQIGWALPAADGSLIAGLQGALYRFDPDRCGFEHWMAVESALPGNRLNDACCSPGGELWFGSMDDAEAADTGRIYRCVAGAIEDSGLPPVCITNGPAFSPDGDTLYHVDTLGRRIFASNIDSRGRPRATRLFASIEVGAGYPDGPVADAEGCLWIGLFGGWAARRYAPDGRVLEQVRFPVANVTKLAFGGPDLRTAFATTARKGLSAESLQQQPLAGDVFSFRVDVPGLPVAPARLG